MAVSDWMNNLMEFKGLLFDLPQGQMLFLVLDFTQQIYESMKNSSNIYS
jgi:hypothetical protein